MIVGAMISELPPAEATSLYGTDECIAHSSYVEVVRFYARFLANDE